MKFGQMMNDSIFRFMTDEEEYSYKKTHKYQILANWFEMNFMYSIIPLVLAIILFLTAIIFVIFTHFKILVDVIIIVISFAISLPIISFYIYLKYLNRLYDDIYSYKCVEDIVKNKIINIGLINPMAISKKEWKKIKKQEKDLYIALRSEESRLHPFQNTYELAKTISNPKIKILWVVNYSPSRKHKYAQAVIEKNDFIYDPVYRRTYLKENYFNYLQTFVYCEFSYEDYMKNIPNKEGFLSYCQENNVSL